MAATPAVPATSVVLEAQQIHTHALVDIMEPRPAVRLDATHAQTTQHAQGETVLHLPVMQNLQNAVGPVAVPAQPAAIAQGIT